MLLNYWAEQNGPLWPTCALLPRASNTLNHVPAKKKWIYDTCTKNQTRPVLDILPCEWHFPLSNSLLTYAQTKLNFARSKFILLLLRENLSFFPPRKTSSVQRPYMALDYWILLDWLKPLITKNDTVNGCPARIGVSIHYVKLCRSFRAV